MNNLEKDMLRDNQIYLNKIELGRKIAAIIDEGESLTMKRKEHIYKIASEVKIRRLRCMTIISEKI